MDHIPDVEHVRKAYEFELRDSTGQTVKFGELMNENGKTVVIFIRHFFCGACQAYVSQLAQVRDEALEKTRVRVLVIGCGDYQPIKSYQEKTGYTGPIYADSKRELFKHFGLTESLKVTPSDQKLKSYLAGNSRIVQVLGSIWTGPLQQPQHIGKQGSISQLGGEFIFGPNDRCLYAHRMQHTEDHTELADVLEHAGVQSTK